MALSQPQRFLARWTWADDDRAVTWVVGAATVDIGVLIGDIRISYADGSRLREETRYGVQKLHQVVPSIWMGYAGSIAIGFAMVEQFREAARAVAGSSRRPEPADVVSRWAETSAREYEATFDESWRTAGCHMLVVGASQKWVESNDGRPLFRVARGYRIEMPWPGDADSTITELPFNQFDSIGSGEGVEEYRSLLSEATADGRQGPAIFSPSAGQGFGDAWSHAGFITSLALGSVIERRPELGISTHLFSAVVTAEGTMFSHNADADVFVENGRTRRVPPLPRIARSFAELQRFERRLSRPPGSIAVG